MDHKRTDFEKGHLSETLFPHPDPKKQTSGSRCATRKRLLKLHVTTAFLLASVIVWRWTGCGQNFTSSFGKTSPKPESNDDDDVLRSCGNYSPYAPAADYPSVPSGCEISQVNILQRHGARYPTKSAASEIVQAVTKIKSVKEYTNPLMSFLSDFTYDLGTDSLVPFGAMQSSESGSLAYNRYSQLVEKHGLPFVRTTSSQRVVDSANSWTQGFSLASSGKFDPKVSVKLKEKYNDTLHNAMCPNAGSANEEVQLWTDKFAPSIALSLNQGAPGANLDENDISSLISLCPYETVAKQARSPFCDLFKSELGAFPGFEYALDLESYYGTGYGQELGPIQGVGYINELLARLTNTPVQDHTQTNRTLDSSPKTFPLGRAFYADFSHDRLLISVFSAMGLFRPSSPLDPTNPDPERTFLASKLVPFSARMVVERLECGDERGTSVRVLVNDALQPLEFCGGDQNGLCQLDKFVLSQAYARNSGYGDFDKCGFV